MKASRVKIFSICLIFFLSFQLQAFSQAENKHAFFFSEKFSQRFELNFSVPAEKWSGTIGVLIEKDHGKPYPFCKIDLYLGSDVKFDYPVAGSYFNLLGKKRKETFFFTDRLNNEDAQYTTRQTLKGSNKLILKAFDDSGKITAMTGLTISAVYRDIVQGIHLVKLDPVMCNIMAKKNHQIKLIFEEIFKEGDSYRARKINEYALPEIINDL